MKYIITENQYNNTIDKFMTYLFESHEEIKTKKFPDSIFWVKEGEVIAEILQSKYFYVSQQIWKSISVMFSLENDETLQVIKDWLEEHYKLGGLKPLFFSFNSSSVLEEHYKLK
jgi:hypothetical protein